MIRLDRLSRIRQSCFSISTNSDMLNVRLPIRDPTTNRLTDEFLHNYENPMFRAYMEKRKLKRSEVWPKIHILGEPPACEQVHLKSQKTFDVKRLISEEMMKKIVNNDPSQINTVFIVSLFSEDNFKELIDQYLSKVLVCGKSPSPNTADQMKILEQRTIEYFRMFYFGENLSGLEREIQMNYLASKQRKFSLMQENSKNVLLKCTWKGQDQRLIEDIANWPEYSINSSDLSYRPFFQRLMILSRMPYAKKLYQLIEGTSLLANWNFRTIRRNYEYSIPYLNWIKTKMFTRVIQYSKCLQFTHRLKIPADFTIDILITNIHIWLITNRLKQIGTKKSKNLADMLQAMFKVYINDMIGSLHMKRQAGTIRKFNQFANTALNVLNKHFNVNPQTKANPYLSIDALVWSIAMKEKTERYSDEVYLFAEYLVKNWEMFKNYTEEDFMDGICEFDPFLHDPDYKEKIMAINPPVSKSQFEQQFKSNKENKSFYYNSHATNSHYAEELANILRKSSQQQKYSFWSEFGNKIVYVVKKYFINLKVYDQISQMEAQKKSAQKKDKDSAWQTETDRIKKAEEQFGEIENLRRNRRKSDGKDTNTKRK